MKIAILNFSGRTNGNCSAVSQYISDKFAAHHVSSYDVKNDSNPCGNCNYECLNPSKVCPNVSAFQMEVMDAVTNSDTAYFIIPNYCGMPCANYYAFSERSVGYFNLDRNKMKAYMSVKKKFVVISNTETDQFVNALRQQVNEDPDILYLKTRKYGKQSITGDILESEAARADLDAWLK